MVGYSLFCIRDSGLTPRRDSVFLEILQHCNFFFHLQGLDFIESSFAYIQSFWYILQFPHQATREKVLIIHLLSLCVTKMLLKHKIFCRGMNFVKNMTNTYRGANQGKTSMSKGALVKKFTNLNSFLIIKQGNINKRIMSSIYINKTKNISFSSNAKY